MTAVVGILNKEAVAIAADSAVTIGNAQGRKIFNRANKIFALSKHQPVGIMLYNSAAFMGTPWEIIIKMYREELNKKTFGTLQEYQADFIGYLKRQPFFSHVPSQQRALGQFCYSLLEFVNTIVFRENLNLQALAPPERKIIFIQKIEVKLDEFIEDIKSKGVHYPDLAGHTFESFETLVQDILEEIIDHLYHKNDIHLSDDLRQKVLEFLFLAFKNMEDKSPYTGLVFAGYGTDEIYPSLNAINVSFAVSDNLRYHQPVKHSVSEEDQSAIFPFAQTDVINTILSGTDPTIWNIYLGNFDKFIRKYNDLILQTVSKANPELVKDIQGIRVEHLIEEFVKSIEQVRRNDVITPMMMAVGTLSKEDLAEMAESLVYLTYLKRRFTFAEESVGGPVDVAVISKGDGFIWMKRKHYFKAELNPQFFSNYFK